MIRGATCVIAALLLVASCGDFDPTPYQAAIVERFDDGVLMDTQQATCVAEEADQQIDWQLVDDRGVAPDQLFANEQAPIQLTGEELDALVVAIDRCRGAPELVLLTFSLRSGMTEGQLGCFAQNMIRPAARDLLRLILSSDPKPFVGTDGEILLGQCSGPTAAEMTEG